jgi:hypothetical protein
VNEVSAIVSLGISVVALLLAQIAIDKQISELKKEIREIKGQNK